MFGDIMALTDIFSRRKRLAEKVAADIYQYEVVPPKVRVQIVHILVEAIGPSHEYHPDKVWTACVKFMRK